MAHPQSMIPPEVELWAVKAELDLAKKTIDRYAHLVTKLYDQLDTLSSGICSMCKMKLVHRVIPSSPTPTPVSLLRWMFGGCSSAQLRVQPATKAISDVCNAETSTTGASFEQTLVLPPKNPQTSAVDIIANPPVAKSNELDWYVVHNHDVRKTLDIRLAHTLKMKSKVYVVTFSRKGEYLAVGLDNGETYIYNMQTLSYKILTEVDYYVKEQPGIRGVQFSPDDKYIATGAVEGQITVWNLEERRVLAMFKSGATIAFVDFSPNGQFLLSGSFDYKTGVHIWCMRDGSLKELFDATMDFARCVAISPDGRCVAAGDHSGVLRIWDFRSGQLLQRWKATTDLNFLHSVAFTSDGKGLLSGGKDRILKFWDISSFGSRRGELDSGSIDEEKECLTFKGHTKHILTTSICPDTQWVLSGSADSTVRIWDARTGAWQCTLDGHQEYVRGLSASPDGQHLASGSRDGLVRVWRYKQTE